MLTNEPEHIVQLRDTLRRFVAAEMPRASAVEWDKANHFPRDVFAKLAELGVMGLTAPEELGGVGRDIVATMVVVEELSKRSLAVSVPYIMAACYAGMNIVECGSEAQKADLLPRIAAGEMLFAYGWTEPDVGADLASVRTTAVRDGDRLIVNGAKRFCSGAAISDYIYTLVRTGDRDARYRNLSFVLIPPDAPGVTIEGIEALGMKGAATTDVTFDDVSIPLDNLVGGEAGWNAGWAMLTGAGLDVEKLEVAAIGVGIAQAALDDAWDYAHQRQQFGKPIATYQSIQHKLADMATKVHTARLILYDAARIADAHEPCGMETSMAKMYATEVSKAVALEAMTICGAYGYVKGFDVERYVRDALLMPIIGGSTAVQLNNIYKGVGPAHRDMTTGDESILPLAGIRVLELGSLIAGPYASALFAQFGAEVIKVEPPGTGDPLRKWRRLQDGTSLWWYVQSRNKKSVAIDLGTAEGQALIRSLVGEVDLVIENFRPGTLERWGLGWERLSAINPKLIMVRVSGYGQTGPRRNLPGFAAIAEAMGGLRHVTGFPDRPPVRAGISIGDTLASLYATIGAMIALHHLKVNGGTGQYVDVALYEAVFATMESLVPEYDVQGFTRERSGASLPGISPSSTYPCKCGQYVVIAGNGDALFKRLMTSIGRDDLAADPGLAQNDGRVSRNDELDAAIGAWTSLHDIDTVIATLEAAAVPAGRIYTAADICNDDHYAARGMIETHRIPDGPSIRIPGIVPKLSATPGRTRWLGPTLGEHQDEIAALADGKSDHG